VDQPLKPVTPTTRPTSINVVFTPHRLADFKPPEGSQTVAVLAFRRPSTFADVCHVLRGEDREDAVGIPFRAVDLQGVRALPPLNPDFEPLPDPFPVALAEALLAQAIAISFGYSQGLVLNEEIRPLMLPTVA
jgi:hypothetical protein